MTSSFHWEWRFWAHETRLTQLLFIDCHLTASLKFCKYLVSQSKFYLPREHQIIKYIGMHKSNKMFIILSNVLNWVNRGKIGTSTRPVWSFHEIVHSFLTSFNLFIFWFISFNDFHFFISFCFYVFVFLVCCNWLYSSVIGLRILSLGSSKGRKKLKPTNRKT
jgi:hypothetical protein